MIEVVDAQGRPVPGLDLAVAPDTDYYGERALPTPRRQELPPTRLQAPFPSPFYPAVRVQFVLQQAAEVRVTVEDVEGLERRLLLEETTAAGTHSLDWNGRDEDGAIAPSGVYFARLVVTDADDGSLLLDDRQPMLLARMGNGNTGIGATDADGRLLLDDRRLFPNLYDLGPLSARDENGDEIGLIELTPTTRFILSDPLTEQRQRFDRDVTGSARFRFVWEPPQ